MTTVSIVIHLTPRDMLLRALRSLDQCAVDTVYIIDNSPRPIYDEASTPNSFQYKTVYRHVENRGFGAAHNIAIRMAMDAGSDFHLVMNPDVEWQGDAIGPLVEYMETHTDVGMASPRVLYPDGVLQYACRMLPTPFDLFLKRFLPSSLTRRRMQRYLLKDADHSRPFNCPYLLGSFLLFHTDALRDAGLFDERFFMYPEDIDITRRLHRDWKTMYLPITTITHRHAAASRKNMKMFCIHFSNMIRYFNKWGWIFDKERRDFNRRLLQELPRYPEGVTPPQGRG